MGNDGVDAAHRVHLVRRVLAPEEEDLASELLPHHLRQIRAAVPAVEAAHIGVGLLEPRVLARGESEITGDVQAVATTGGPPVHQRDDDLGHEADQPLHLENVQPPGAGLIHGVGGLAAGVLIAAAPANALVAAGAEGPAAVLG